MAEWLHNKLRKELKEDGNIQGCPAQTLRAAHNTERVTPMPGLRHGVLTGRFIPDIF